MIIHREGSSQDGVFIILPHPGSGLLSMVNSKSNTNAYQLFLTCAQHKHLDGGHVAFDQLPYVLGNMEVVSIRANSRPHPPPSPSPIAERCREREDDGGDKIFHPIFQYPRMMMGNVGEK